MKRTFAKTAQTPQTPSKKSRRLFLHDAGAFGICSATRLKRTAFGE